MSLASWIADRLVLQPTRDPIDPEDRRRRWIDAPRGGFEVWIADHRPEDAAETAAPLRALKFPGAGGRAERGTAHPLDLWPGVAGEVWVVNPPGYGGSGGRASLQRFADMADEAWRAASEGWPHPLLLVGNSIGCLPVLYLAARYSVGGVFLRNPVPLADLILGRYSWWNFGLLTHGLTAALPSELEPRGNARRATAPALFVHSGDDRLVPLAYQQRLVEAYAGPKSSWVIAGIDHHEPIPPQARDGYRQALQWLDLHRRRSFAAGA